MTVYALNGLGRMGKIALRQLLERGARIAWINDAAGDPETHAHLLEFDTVHGRWDARFEHDCESLSINGARLPVLRESDPARLPLDGVDVVVECTGAFKTEDALAPHFEAGVRKAVVSAPVKGASAANVVFGVNNEAYDPAAHRIATAASCTTNCLAPVIKVIHESLRIRHGSMTTIHDATNTQTIVDRPGRDLRRSRSALNSLIPTTTGSAEATTMIYPELKGRLNGRAVRVPVLNASLTDCVLEVETSTSVDDVNALLKAAADGPLAGILGVEDRPLVSADYASDPRSSIVDAPSTMVVDGTQVKIFAWYDGETGYAHRLVDVALMVGDSL